jgi:hypothetical protein
MKTLNSSFYILSAYRPEFTEKENRLRSEQLFKQLERLGLKPIRAKGMYKGERELSFIVPYINTKTRERLFSIAFSMYEQESVLFVDNDKSAYLIYLDNNVEHIGSWEQVDRETAESQDAYTYIRFNDSYYIVT